MNQQTRNTRTKKVRKPSQNQITVGIDLGDRWSHYCILDEEANVVEEGRFRIHPVEMIGAEILIGAPFPLQVIADHQ